MRTIKYQLVWQGAIYEPLDMRQLAGGQWEIEGKMYEDNEKNGNKKGDYVSIPRKDYVFFSEDESDFGIWRQFTGLFDKNGVDVFEGDIVRHKNSSFTKTRHGYSTKVVEYKKTEKYIGYSDCSNYEIIGNIYENPELFPNQ